MVPAENKAKRLSSVNHSSKKPSSSSSKINNLNEMLVPKVQLLIKGLPYNSEGYEKAKNILKSIYGKSSKRSHSKYLKFILISGSNPVKIYDFYEKLITNVQSLDTMGKSKLINGYVRSILDELPGIRTEIWAVC